MQVVRTCDIWIWAEPKGTVIVRCGIQAVRCDVARYRAREIEEVQHIFCHFAFPHPISGGVVRPVAIWVKTLDTGGEVDLGHREREFGFTDVRRLNQLYIPNSHHP